MNDTEREKKVQGGCKQVVRFTLILDKKRAVLGEARADRDPGRVQM